MLNPDARRTYTDALRPPPGFRFGEAIAATYSLDLETLLTIPLHLALFSAEQPIEELLKDGVALLESLRRTIERVTVYAQSSRILAPARLHVLYGLLEPTVVEVAPPSGSGSFHPKLWLIRFDHPDTGATRFRLLVLTRNLTADRCWDLVLTLEGVRMEEPYEANRELAELLSRLPTLAVRGLPPERSEATRKLADAALRTEWELPGGFEQVRFHALGLGGSPGWLPRPSEKLAVISPFLTNAALEALLDSTKQAIALVSRPEALNTADPELLRRFNRVMVLAEQAELDDGEEAEPRPAPERPTHGLHAKVYLAKRGWDTHLYVGSANATDPALVRGINVELVAELSGKSSKVGAVEDLLDSGGLGAILMDHLLEAPPEPLDAGVVQARQALERARRRLATAGLRIRFAEGESGWAMDLIPEQPVELNGIMEMRVWLITRRSDTAVSSLSLSYGATARLPEAPLSLLTSFVAFELTAEAADESVRFVLNLETEDMPVAERDAAVVRDVVRNQEGFLRYVMLLLAGVGEEESVFGIGAGSWERFERRPSHEDDLPLFEHLTRAFTRDPERLRSIRRLLDDIGHNNDGEVVPPEFLDLWAVFEAALPAGQSVEG
ncbi:MAG: phospholipase D family protein [Longimicrobiaceae bacterium]